MTRAAAGPRLRVVHPCCDAGATKPCPVHETWRRVEFLAPPPLPDDEEDEWPTE